MHTQPCPVHRHRWQKATGSIRGSTPCVTNTKAATLRGQLRFARRLPSAENGDRPDPDDVASEDTERWTAFSKSTPIHSISEDGETGVTDDRRQAEPQEELSESEALSAAVVLSSNGYTGRREGSESDCDSDEMGGAKVAPEAPRPNDPVYSPAFIQEEDTEEDGLTVEAGYGKDGHENEIVEVEVENSGVETTVTLVHILPLLKASGRAFNASAPPPVSVCPPSLRTLTKRVMRRRRRRRRRFS